MPTSRARIRRAAPGIIPGLLVVIGEAVVAVFLILYLQGSQHNLCVQLARARVSSNLTVRDPLRQFALDAAAARDKSGDHAVAAQYRRIAARIHNLPPLKC